VIAAVAAALIVFGDTTDPVDAAIAVALAAIALLAYWLTDSDDDLP